MRQWNKYWYRGRQYTTKELYDIAAREYGCNISMDGFRIRLRKMSPERAVESGKFDPPEFYYTCEICGRPFTSASRKAKLCSYECRKTKAMDCHHRESGGGNDEWSKLGLRSRTENLSKIPVGKYDNLGNESESKTTRLDVATGIGRIS